MEENIIERVSLVNFRSHTKYSLDCNKKTTLILGENGWGKTSILEAIYIALQGKSFRAVDREIVKRGDDFYRVELEYKNGESVVVTYGGEPLKKNFLIKNKKTIRLPKAEKYPVILFLPEDLHLVATSPTKRRDYFDKLISQLDEKYHTYLLRYNKALKQRNEALKKEFVNEESLFSWNVMLAKYGVDISRRRKAVIEKINQKLTKTYQSIANNKDNVKIDYEEYIGDIDESGYLRLLDLDFERDKITGHTNFGIHKDDYNFRFNKALADGSASRGEVRSIVLALKFIEAELIEEVSGRKPVVLLDDVFSELDKERQKSLVKNFKNHQVILTSVDGVEV